MKVLVTGYTGFVGSHVWEQLIQSNIEPIALPKNAFPLENAKDASFLANIDAIIHLAGKPRGTERELVDANLSSTVQLLLLIQEVATAPIPFIFASSFSVYAAQEELLNEKSKTGPNSFYGKTKLWAEEAINYFASKKVIKSRILRLANVYGPGMPPYSHSVISTFIKQIVVGEEITINGNGNQERDFIFVKDVGDVILKTLMTDIESDTELITIASGQKTSLNDLINLIETETGKTAKVRYNTSYKESGNWIGDSQKAFKLLNWKPKTSLQEGIKLMIK